MESHHRIQIGLIFKTRHLEDFIPLHGIQSAYSKPLRLGSMCHRDPFENYKYYKGILETIYNGNKLFVLRIVSPAINCLQSIQCRESLEKSV